MDNYLHSIFTTGAFILGGSFAVLLVLSLLYIKPYRKLFITMLMVNLTATIAYVAMAHSIGMYMYGNKLISFTRYIDWMITTPLLLYVLTHVMIIKGKERDRTVLSLVILDICMLLAGLISELSNGWLIYVWFMVSGGCYLAMLYIVIQKLLLTEERSSDPALRAIALHMAWVVICLWSLYPFVWILGIHGIELLSYNYENVGYLILDVLTKVGFSSLLLRYLFIVSRLNLIPLDENTFS
jgi:bacteriorhodopsin